MIRPLPLPPLEMRELIRAHAAVGFDNPTGAPIWDDLPREAWAATSTSAAAAGAAHGA